MSSIVKLLIESVALHKVGQLSLSELNLTNLLKRLYNIFLLTILGAICCVAILFIGFQSLGQIIELYNLQAQHIIYIYAGVLLCLTLSIIIINKLISKKYQTLEEEILGIKTKNSTVPKSIYRNFINGLSEGINT